MPFMRALISPVAHLWVVNSASSWRSLPRPGEPSFASASGVDPHRLLLIGSGMAVSYGVLSHDLGLAGHLARELAARTGRGAQIDVRAASEMTAPSATEILTSLDLGRYDAILLTLGGLETLNLQSPRIWGDDLSALLDAVASQGQSAPTVYVVGTGTMPDYLRMPALLARAALRHGPLIEAQSRQVCEQHDRAVFVPFEPRSGDVVRYANRETYEEWAAMIAPAISRDLSLPATRAELTVDDEVRVAEVDRLGVFTAPPSPELDRLVATVRHLFAVEAAMVTIVHRDRMRVWSGDGLDLGEVPRTGTLCDLTIRRSGHTVVEDVSSAPDRWVTAPGADWVKFYAGYPIESARGLRLGTLAVLSSQPRPFTAADGTLLRDFALRVQALIWERAGIES